MTVDGPFPIFAHDPVTRELTAALAAGVHYKVDPAALAAFSAILRPYVVTPSDPLQNVWAGDDPAAPVLTVPLRFPDAATAAAVLAACGWVAP